MKKSIIYLLWMVLISCPIFMACSDDSKQIANPYPDVLPVTDWDEVNYLQNSLVRVDADGKLLYRVCGEPLDDADTTQLYLGVKGIAEAQELFRGFFPENTQFIQDGMDITATLKGNAGTVTFEVKGEGEELARVIFNTTPSLKLVSALHFLDERAWPDNATPNLEEGDILTIGEKKYVCIRIKSNGLPSLVLHISPSPRMPYDNWLSDKDYAKDNSASNVTASEAKNICNMLFADKGKKFYAFQEAFKRAGSSLDKEADYWIKGREASKDRFHDYYFTIHLGTGEISKQNWGTFAACKEFCLWETRNINL